jgi:hypothetical protein
MTSPYLLGKRVGNKMFSGLPCVLLGVPKAISRKFGVEVDGIVFIETLG